MIIFSVLFLPESWSVTLNRQKHCYIIMSGNKCVYAKCGNSKYYTPKLKMFSFPYKDSVRCEKWKIYTGNSDLLNLEGEELKAKFICEAHFSENSYINSTKHRLVHDALPVPYKSTFETQLKIQGKISSQVLEPTSLQGNMRVDHWKNDIISPIRIPSKTYSKLACAGNLELINVNISKNPVNSSVSMNNLSDLGNELQNFYCSPVKKAAVLERKELKRRTLFDECDASPRKKKIIRRYRQKSKELIQKKKQLKYLKTKLEAVNTSHAKLSDFLKSQLNNKKVVKWTQPIRDMAVSVYYTSPAAYKCLKKHNIKLPGVSTIKKWLNSFDLGPGFSDDVLAKIKSSASKLSKKHKMCVLSFDEMSIKKQLDYNKSKDIIEGFQDLGHLGREAVMGDHALVFYVKGIFGNWKTPVGYFISSNTVSAKHLAELVKKCLEHLNDCGLNIKAIVCDQGTNNRAAVKQLGVKQDQPYFCHENKKYYAFYDVPHLIKSVRNQLLQHNFEIDGCKVSWYDVKETYFIDKKSETAKALPKITWAHIKPNPWQKMRVKYAVQIFSNSMAAAIKTAVLSKQLHKPALNTASFIETLDRLFDALNSRTYKCSKKPFLRALSDGNSDVEKLLQDSIEWISRWETDQGKRPPCFKGLQSTIQGILSLYIDMEQEGVSYLPTRRLNQDCLENLFSIIRKRCGYERNPSARTMRLNLRAIINNNLKISNENANCEDSISDKNQNLFTSAATVSQYKIYGNTSLHININPKDLQNINLENCARKYTGGYVVKKCIEKFKCPDCKQHLLCSEESRNETDTLILEKNYDFQSTSLYVPSKLTNQVFSTCLILINQNYKKFWAGQAVLETLEEIITPTINEQHPVWNSKFSCANHRRFFIYFTILLFLFKKTLWTSREARETQQRKINKKQNVKNHPKITVLNHI